MHADLDIRTGRSCHAHMSTTWYDAAEFYDFLYDADTAQELRFLWRTAKRFGTQPRRVLEPACGSGRLLRAFARRGCRVVGFDTNPNALRYASDSLRADSLRARLSRQDLADFDCGRGFDLAHCLLSTFKYLPRDTDALSHLRCVARALRPGGLYVLGLHLCDPAQRGWSTERWQRARRGLQVEIELASSPPDLRRRRERVRVELRARRGKERFESRESWWWRTWTAEQLSRLLRRIPELELAAVYDFDFAPRELDDDRLDKILVLRRLSAQRNDQR